MLFMRNDVYGWIYKITNTVNGKVYIGLTVEGFDKRYYGKGIIASKNRHLQLSIAKYGVEAFVVDKEWDIAYSKEELDDLEKYWIYLYDATNSKHGYNIQSGGHNGRPSAETKAKTSKSMKLWHKENGFTEEQKQKISEEQKGAKNSFYGKQHSTEQKQKWSEQRKGVVQDEQWRKKNSESLKQYHKDNPYTEEQLEQKSQSMKQWHKSHLHPRSKSVICVETKEVFLTGKAACEKYGFSRSRMCEHLKGRVKHMVTKDGLVLTFQYA